MPTYDSYKALAPSAAVAAVLARPGPKRPNVGQAAKAFAQPYMHHASAYLHPNHGDLTAFLVILLVCVGAWLGTRLARRSRSGN